MSSNKLKQMSILIILAVSFLLESPLRATVFSTFFFLQPFAKIIISIVFYIALFACITIAFAPKSTLKSLCVVAAFAIFEQAVSAFFLNGILSLFYAIIKPLLVVAVIVLAKLWIQKGKITADKAFLPIAAVLFALGALFNVLEYFRMLALVESLGDNIFSFLSLMASGNSIYSILAALCAYALAFVTLTSLQKSNLDSNS